MQLLKPHVFVEISMTLTESVSAKVFPPPPTHTHSPMTSMLSPCHIRKQWQLPKLINFDTCLMG